MKSAQRKKSYQRGLWAENVGVLFLRLKGYQIIERRAKTPLGEIDIIAKRGNILIAVEVKARASQEIAAYSITATQKQRIARALVYWCQHHQNYLALDKRFDAMLVAPWAFPHHILDAWQT